MCMAHFPDVRAIVESPLRLTAGGVELYVDPGDHQWLTWNLLAVAVLLLRNWLEMYEYRTLKFEQWYYGEWLVATGTLSRVGAE